MRRLTMAIVMICLLGTALTVTSAAQEGTPIALPVAVTGTVEDCHLTQEAGTMFDDCTAVFSDPRLNGRYVTRLEQVSDCYPPLLEGPFVCLGSFSAELEGPDGTWDCYEVIVDLRVYDNDDDNVGHCRGRGGYSGLGLAYRRSMTIVDNGPELAYRGVIYEGAMPDWVPLPTASD